MKTTTKKRTAPEPAGTTDLVQQAAGLPDTVATPIVQALTELVTEAGKVTPLLARGRELHEQYKGVAFDCTTTKGMRDATEARRLLRAEARFPLQHLKTDVSKQLGSMQRQWNDALTTYCNEIEGYETPIDDQITAQERREKERKDAHELKIRAMQAAPERAIGKDSQAIAAMISELEAVDLTTFEEYREAAAGAAQQAGDKLRHLKEQAEALEEQRRDTTRKANIRNRIDAITMIGSRVAMCRSSERVKALIDEVEAVTIDVATFEEFIASAQATKDNVLASLRITHANKVAAETPVATPAPSPAPQQWSDEPQRMARIAKIGDALSDAVERGDYLPRELSGGERLFDRVTGAVADVIRTGTGTFGGATTQDLQIDNTPAVPQAIEQAIRTERPTDAEILALVVSHYDVEPLIAAAWLHNFDADAAIAQQSLIA